VSVESVCVVCVCVCFFYAVYIFPFWGAFEGEKQLGGNGWEMGCAGISWYS